MIPREHVHILVKGRRHRTRAKGRPRKMHLHVLISPQLQLSLMHEAARNRETVGMFVERALWKLLGQIAARKGARIVERLRHANALIEEVLALGSPIMIAGTVRIPGQAPSPDIHVKEPRQQRRNRISDKSSAAFDEVYDLAQTEAVSSNNKTRAMMYMVLARLAEVNEALLRGASEEEVLAEIAKLREEQERFEEATRIMEEEAKESAETQQAAANS